MWENTFKLEGKAFPSLQVRMDFFPSFSYFQKGFLISVFSMKNAAKAPKILQNITKLPD